jgi:hypothetical protein
MHLRELLLTALVLTLATAARPAAAEPEGPAWLVSIGGDVDEDGGYRVDGGLTWAPTLLTAVTLQGGLADTSTDFERFKADLATASFDHFFGPFGLNVDARWWNQHDLFSSTTFGGSLYYKAAGWRVSVRGESRTSDLDEFSFDTVIPIRGVEVPISGRGECSLDNIGYGLTVSHTGKAWTGLVSGVNYDYSVADCNLTGVTLPPQVGNLGPISREIFRRIATRVLRAGAVLVGNELTRENGFLDYSIWAALGYRAGLNTFGLDYYHDREEFAGLKADTLIGSMSFPVSDRLDLELRLGVSDSDIEGTTAFAGVTLIAYLGGAP